MFFASAILYLNKLIGDMHAGVAGLSGTYLLPWMQMPELRWRRHYLEASASADETPHLHAGFYVGDDRAVSNGSNSTLMPGSIILPTTAHAHCPHLVASR